MMINALLTSAVAYIGTNIDDIFMNTLFFAQADTGRKIRSAVIGKYLGLGSLVLLSLLGAHGLQFIPQKYIGALGLIPIILGLRAWHTYRKEKQDHAQQDSSADVAKGFALSMMLVTVANGADNIGVYIPLFAGYTAAQTTGAVVTFALMTALWCWLSKKLADLPTLRAFLLEYKHVIVPVVFISLGIYIIARSGLID